MVRFHKKSKCLANYNQQKKPKSQTNFWSLLPNVMVLFASGASSLSVDPVFASKNARPIYCIQPENLQLFFMQN